MKIDIAKLLKAHGWKALYTTVSIIATIIGTTYAYAVTQTTSSFATQNSITSLQHSQAALEQRQAILEHNQDAISEDVQSIKQSNSRLEGKVDTVIDLLQRRRP